MRVTPLYLILLNFVNIDQADNILEVGCGPATMVPHLLQRKKPTAKVTISDFSEDMLTHAMHKVKLLLQDPYSNIYAKSQDAAKFTEDQTFDKLMLTVKCLNAEQLTGLADNSFDAYLSNLALQLVPDYKQAIKESYRVLRPSGRCAYSVWGRLEESPLLSIPVECLHRMGIQVPKNLLKFHLGDPDMMTKEMEAAGYRNALAWYQFVSFNVLSEKDVDQIIDEQISLRKLINLAPQEKQAELLAECKQKMMDFTKQTKKPIGIEYLIVYGQK